MSDSGWPMVRRGARWLCFVRMVGLMRHFAHSPAPRRVPWRTSTWRIKRPAPRSPVLRRCSSRRSDVHRARLQRAGHRGASPGLTWPRAGRRRHGQPKFSKAPPQVDCILKRPRIMRINQAKPTKNPAAFLKGISKNRSVLGQMERWRRGGPLVAGHGGAWPVRRLPPAGFAQAHVVPVSPCAAGRTRVARSAMRAWCREKRFLFWRRRGERSGRSEHR